MEFGPYLRNLRNTKGIKQRDFAAQMGISPAYLCSIERAKCAPPHEQIVKLIAQALEADENTMLSLANESRPPKQKRVCTEETRRRISIANMGRRPTMATRQKLKMARMGKKDPEPTRAKKRANLERARAIQAAMREESKA